MWHTKERIYATLFESDLVDERERVYQRIELGSVRSNVSERLR